MAAIMVVDDNAANRDFLATLLGYGGHRVLQAADGAEALTAARFEKLDLVISDILMPTMDGFELVASLRNLPQTARLPVIFATAYYHGREALHLAQSCGVHEVLVKPLEPEVVLRAVERALAATPLASAQPPAEQFEFEHLRLLREQLSAHTGELTAANHRLRALIDVNLQLASERDPWKLLQLVCHSARGLVGAGIAVLVQTQRDAAVQRGFVESGVERTGAAGPVLRADLAQRLLEGRGAFRPAGSEDLAGCLGGVPGYPPLRCALLAPVVSLSHFYGWLLLANKIGAEAFTDEDERVIAILSAQLGRIYENGSLYKELENRAEQLREELGHRTDAQRRLGMQYAVAQVLAESATLEEASPRLLRAICEDQGFAFAALWELDRDAGVMRCSSVWHQDSPGLKEFADFARTLVLGRGDSLPGLTWEKGRPVWFTDATENPPAAFPRVALGRKAQLHTAIAFPVGVGGEVTGVIEFSSREAREEVPGELEVFAAIGSQVGQFIERRRQRQRLDFLANYDELTGLANRALFVERLRPHLQRRERDTAMVAVILIDLDRFRMVNDTLGRTGGDELLRAVAQRLSKFFAGHEPPARVAGNWFAAVVRGVQDTNSLARLVDRVCRSTFADPFQIAGREVIVSVRAGVALFPQDGSDAEVLLGNADAALRRAREGGEPFLLYAPEMNARVAEALLLETRLRRALQQSEFVLHYQPKVDLRSGAFIGAEALLRWQDPQTGLVPPGKFIPILEESGLILDVGKWAIERALSDRAAWASQGVNVPRVAVNVSSIQLQQKDFVNTVVDAVQRSGDEADALELEITESLIMRNVEDSIRKLSIVRGMGAKVSIDDFGTGYSSLSYIARLPIDALKIDRSFVSGLAAGGDAATIVATTIALAHGLKLKVVAEGVETEAQAEALRKLGCDEAQGYLFSKPVPPDAIPALYRKK